MIKAIAIDDEPVALEIIRMHADKIPFISLEASFVNAKEALQYIHQHTIQLVFMDISMPDISGLEMAEMLKNKCQIIFTTAYAEHALKGFELAAADYLLKPINFNRFLQACQQAENRINAPAIASEEKSLFVKDGYNWIQIRPENITYAQAQDNYVSIHEPNRRTLTRMTLVELLDRLPAGRFIRVHKSYAVALNKIDKIERHQLTINGENIPLSATYRDELTRILEP
ncbi:LytR/AlgR family response regulator transcription factor [Mucilaginibacter sp. KACC 22063]|uniref:LytR/AlgR family response regulator transcription factor n=1 Tax=Mucilaginibacter sp. KACC 22063 TaxID=3025666 RepID=UPI002365B368|nr:LytTR family DNA-binding domain-containing protein [Mucilaginibacter sp. KACC 22063]WDF55290.1 LytTR family DNA-binding domain-containing protein [Mucilaginibacter sp. KACC 22063]